MKAECEVLWLGLGLELADVEGCLPRPAPGDMDADGIYSIRS